MQQSQEDPYELSLKYTNKAAMGLTSYLARRARPKGPGPRGLASNIHVYTYTGAIQPYSPASQLPQNLPKSPGQPPEARSMDLFSFLMTRL